MSVHLDVYFELEKPARLVAWKLHMLWYPARKEGVNEDTNEGQLSCLAACHRVRLDCPIDRELLAKSAKTRREIPEA